MRSRASTSPATRVATVLRWLIWMPALALLLVAAASNAQSPAREKRIALVIGNADYQSKRLGNPENDARLIADSLRQLGFDVNEQLNLGVLEFRRALRDFARRVQQDDAVAVLYYAGHGMQIDGRNYLLPVDLNLRDQEEVKDESVDIDDLFLSRIDKVGSHARIVILDACRDNPFGKRKTRTISTSGGLAEMGARGTLIAFASAPGSPAEDGPDGGNSVYSKSLAQEMMVPGVEIEQMFKNVRVRVLRETSGRQLPWVNTSLTSDFTFNSGKPAPAQGVRETGLNQGQRQATAVVPSSAPATAPEQPKDKDIDTLLARMRRESQAAAPKPPAPAVAAAADTAPQGQAPPMPAATPPTAPPPPSAAPKVALAAPQSASAGVTAQVMEPRKFLSQDEMQQLLVGKTHSLKDTTTNDFMRWELRNGGLIYYNSQSPGYLGVNGSGRWELKSDGSLCVKFNAAPPAQPGARRPDDGCWYFLRNGEKLKRVSAAAPEASPQFEVIDIK